MRHIFEIAAGLALVLTGISLATGLSDFVIPQIPVGLGFAGSLAMLGVLLCIDGVLGRRGHAGSSRLAVWTIAVLAVIVMIPLGLAGPLNLFSVAGTPLGYYAGAQGALIAMGVLTFVWTVRQSRLDDAGAASDEP